MHAFDTNPFNNDNVTFRTMEGASTVAVCHVLVDTGWEDVGPGEPFLHPDVVSDFLPYSMEFQGPTSHPNLFAKCCWHRPQCSPSPSHKERTNGQSPSLAVPLWRLL